MSKEKLQDIPSGHDGKGYLTLNGDRVDAFKIAKIEGRVEPIVENKQFLGERVQQNAVRGTKIAGDMSYYNVSKAFAKAWRDYKNGGSVPEIELQYYSDANTGNSDRVEVQMTGVIPEKVSFGALDDSSTDAQKMDTSFTANDFDVL